ncbi:MAG: O-antigen ligase family protein [Anaerolineaceae bacterium]
MISYGLFILACFSLAFNLVRIYGVSIPDSTFIAAFFFVIADEGLLKKKPVRIWFPSHPLFLPAFLILIGGLISSINAVSISSSMSITIKEFYIFTIFTSFTIYMVRRTNPEFIITALLLSGLITSLAAINDYILGYKFSNEILMRLGSVPLNESWDRYSGLLGHPNEQAMFLSVVFPLAFSRFLNSFNKKIIETAIHFVGLVILGAALLLTGSVSGYLSIIISSFICFFWFFYSVIKTDEFFKNVISRLLIGGFFILVILVGIFNTSEGNQFIHSEFFTQSPVSDLLFRSFDRVITTTAISRWDDYVLGLKYIASNPFVGAGMDQTGTGGLNSSQMITYLAIHNTILQSWVAGGLLAFIGTVIIYFHILKFSLRALSTAFSTRTYSILVGLSASSLGFVFIDMTSSNIYQRVKWLVFALLLGLTLFIEMGKDTLISSGSTG